MAPRSILVLLFVAAVAVVSVAKSEDATGQVKIDTGLGRSLKLWPKQPTPSRNFPTLQPTQPTNGFPRPSRPYQPYQPYQPYAPQAIPLDFRRYSKGCPRDYVIKMGAYGLGCLPDTRTSTNPRYPSPDEMSKRLCPNGFLYRLVGNRQPACLPESYVYDGVWAANVPEEDD